jgi:hypothetical protein
VLGVGVVAALDGMPHRGPRFGGTKATLIRPVDHALRAPDGLADVVRLLEAHAQGKRRGCPRAGVHRCNQAVSLRALPRLGAVVNPPPPPDSTFCQTSFLPFFTHLKSAPWFLPHEPELRTGISLPRGLLGGVGTGATDATN